MTLQATNFFCWFYQWFFPLQERSARKPQNESGQMLRRSLRRPRRDRRQDESRSPAVPVRERRGGNGWSRQELSRTRSRLTQSPSARRRPPTRSYRYPSNPCYSCSSIHTHNPPNTTHASQQLGHTVTCRAADIRPAYASSWRIRYKNKLGRVRVLPVD